MLSTLSTTCDCIFRPFLSPLTACLNSEADVAVKAVLVFFAFQVQRECPESDGPCQIKITPKSFQRGSALSPTLALVGNDIETLNTV